MNRDQSHKNESYRNEQNRVDARDSANSASPLEEGVKINGLQQVIDLLKHADPSFRDSLLKRLQARDPKLATSLRKVIR